MRQLFLLLGLFFHLSLFAAYSNVSGKWSPDQYTPTLSVQEHYDFANQAIAQSAWETALIHVMVICYHFPDSPFYGDALFYSGVCYYNLGELDLANSQFNKYLNQSGRLKHFESVFSYKYEIAEFYRSGKKKHLFGLQRLPKWMPAKADAMTLYDEIIAALPGREIAAKALYSKAVMLRVKREFRESIESLKMLTRLYPKESLSADSFLTIAEIYLQQSREEAQNPDLIALAQLNLGRFNKAFPSDERLSFAEKNILAMKENFSKSLYDTGRYYERKKKPAASAIYYQDAIYRFPDTQAALKCRERLAKLGIADVPLVAHG